MKKLAIALAAIAAFTAPAGAADMAVRAPVRAPAPVAYAPSWTGCYIGGGGYGLWNQENTALSMVRRAFSSPAQQRRADVVIWGPWGAAATINLVSQASIW